MGGAIFVYASVWTARIIGLRLEPPFQQGNFEPPTKLVNCGRSALMPRQDGVQFVDHPFCNVTVAGDAVDHQLDRRLVIPQNINQSRRLNVSA
jgi:hypothetical protein